MEKIILFVIGLLSFFGVITHSATSTPPTPQTVVGKSAAATTTKGAAAVQPVVKTISPKPVTLPLPVVAVAPAKPVQIKIGSSTAQSIAAATTTPPVDWHMINKDTRTALVNIICTTARGGYFNPLSGSGVIIDPRGVILTNAHVAEYFLLKDYAMPDFLDCAIRTGEPARRAYRAELLYLPPAWIQANYKNIVAETPTGTGENDFAFLLITGSIGLNTPLPSVFPYIPMEQEVSVTQNDDTVLAAAYPAGFLSNILVQNDLYPVSTIIPVQKIFTFTKDSPDLLNLGGSLVAQEGSSGGAVVGKEKTLLGIIVTSTEAPQTSDRELHAVTTHHIIDRIESFTGKSLDEFLSGNLKASADAFNQNTAPAETKILSDELRNQQ